MITRPTTLRAALEASQIMPSFRGKRALRLLKTLSRAVASRRGYVLMVQRRRVYADGPRPVNAGPITMFSRKGDEL